ncbi:hypothetical protein K5549_000273 [Capra hircus]|nr:hypothetical protein K5549_000273 [Capra hircus]
MFCNMYENDVTNWSPQGRIHQVEYAMELSNKKRAQAELAAHQKKMFLVDNSIAISVAAFTADAKCYRCLNSRFVFDRPLPVPCLVYLIGSKTQIPMQPYDVGLLIVDYDTGPHIFQICPFANYFDCRVMSTGAHSQTACIYLERYMSKFLECNLNELGKHGLDTLPAEQDLTTKNVFNGIVSKDLEFLPYDDDDVSPLMEDLEERLQRKTQPTQPADEPTEKADEPMEH